LLACYLLFTVYSALSVVRGLQFLVSLHSHGGCGLRLGDIPTRQSAHCCCGLTSVPQPLLNESLLSMSVHANKLPSNVANDLSPTALPKNHFPLFSLFCPLSTGSLHFRESPWRPHSLTMKRYIVQEWVFLFFFGLPILTGVGQRFVLGEIIKVSAIDVPTLVDFIRTHQIEPNWMLMQLPGGWYRPEQTVNPGTEF
jgi:hypothetical protein